MSFHPSVRRAAFESLEARQFLSASALDTTFNGSGVVASNFGTDASFNAVTALPDGRVLAAGTVKNGTNFDFLIAQYKANGTPDTSFGGGTGRVYTDFGHSDYAFGIVQTGGGKFAVVGLSQTSDSSAVFAVARYNANGTLDSTFSGDGKLTVDFAGTYDRGNAIAVDANGKLIVAGSTYSDAHRADLAVARINTNGTLDTTFNGTGKKSYDLIPNQMFPNSEEVTAIAVLPSGQILLAGDIDDFGDSGINELDWAVARINANATLDTTFGGGDGWVQTHFTGFTYNFANAIQVLSSGKFVVGGTAEEFYGTPSDNEFAVARYNANGSLDNTFSGDGKVTTNLNPNPDELSDQVVSALAVQPNGTVLAVGSVTYVDPSTSANVLALGTTRYTTSGALDTSYSGDGKQINTQLTAGNAAAIAPGGKVVVAGDRGTKAAVARFGTDAAATASIAGNVYNDLNGNGTKNTGEAGLSGWQVFVDSNNDGFYTPGETIATTDSSGNYKLTGLLPGAYRVREVRLTNWNRTQPAGAYPLGYYDVSLAVGAAVVGKNFGNKHA